MVTDSGRRRSRFANQKFFFSVFCTVFFFSLYWLGLHFVPAPESYLRSLGMMQERKLLGLIFSYQANINFVISVLFGIISGSFWKGKNTADDVNWKKKVNATKSTLSKFLKPHLIATIGTFGCWGIVKNSSHKFYLVLLTYFSFFVSNSVFEIIIRILNDYGVCGGFELVFIVSDFPTKVIQKLFSSLFRVILFTGSSSDVMRSLSLLFIFLISYFFVLASSNKWEVPIDNNRIVYNENWIGYSPTFSLQTNFGVHQLTFASSLITICRALGSFLLKRVGVAFHFFSIDKLFVPLNNDTFRKFNTGLSSFTKTFFAVSNEENPFFDLYQKIKENVNFLPAFLSWLFTIHLTNWLLISNYLLDPQEISEGLRKSGVYINGVRPGEETKKLIRDKVNRLVALWSFYLTLLAFLFDNFVFGLMNSGIGTEELSGENFLHLSFFYLATRVSTVVNLWKQIKKEYNYSRFYD